ncbi:hypothetical protein P5673_027487 [Acropora cervicornis]|uniref:Uncharacterized protein n=1 Tax=Acropora cervicornis TaxID=6130 RepID=A0AAD9PZ07_ACRCE|nr:hypothetical protein P5673_027487 [Acropora cervicornis]
MAKPHDSAVLYVKTLFTTTFMNIKDYIPVDVNGTKERVFEGVEPLSTLPSNDMEKRNVLPAPC